MKTRLVALAGLLALASLAGCDTTIETPDSLQGAYTLWGALNPTTDVQALRVVAVTNTLQVRSAAALPITIGSVDLGTGVETAWRDSLVTYRDGSVGHVYLAAFRPAHGSRHRIVLRRDAGGEITTATTVPPRVVPAVGPTTSFAGVRTPVSWPGAPQLGRLRVTYFYQTYTVDVAPQLTARTAPAQCEEGSVSFGLAGSPGPVEGGWVTDVNFETAFSIITDALPRPPPDTQRRLGLQKVRVQAEVLSEDWRPPGGVFDFEALAASEVFDNVEGGFGFVGAGYPAEVTFFPVPREIGGANFFDTAALCARPG